nr:probable disease resistance protein At5g66900 isoform X2 [Quercus suber]
MAAGAALGAVFGEVFAVFHDSVKEVGSKALMFKPILKSLESQLGILAPLVEDIRQLSEQLELRKVETETLIEHMKKGEKLVRKCSKIRWWNYCFKVYYSTKLQELDNEILKFCQVVLPVYGTRNSLMALSSMNRMLQKVDSVVESLETPRVSCAVPGLRDLTVGLKIPIMELKTLLLKEEVQLLLVTAPGGCGKTTLVQKLCQDDQIKDANDLFCHSASLQDGSSYIPAEEDIKKIVRGCGGFPLVLKVIGGSLCRQKEEVWCSRLMKWSDGRSFVSSDAELLACLQKSLEFQNDKDNIEDCFMDLGSFLEDQRIPVAALIDMWAELYGLDENGIHAIANLQELTTRNLASLVMARKDASEVNNYYNDDFVTQHDILRELAMHQSSQEPEGQRPRLIMNISGNNLPKWWMEQEQLLINARLLSISTDESFSWSWCNIQAPKVEVLVLNFQTKNYTLPEFVEKMDELKVLIVTNYGFFHAKISNFQLLGSLPKFRRIRLEKVSISSLCETLVPLKSLKKISLFMCNIGKAFENCTIQLSNALPNLTEIRIDYCNDLLELPAGLCDIVLLKKLIITNCHKLSALPKGIGKLVNLEVLRFRSCTDLSELPESIRSLHKLSILDISDCLSISKLSKHIGELCNLKVLNMKGCLRLRDPLPESTMELKQLELVVCDEERAKLWEHIKEFLTKLKVEVAEKDINLNWLPK